jgi:hypothetical protein
MSMTRNDDFQQPNSQWEEVEVVFPSSANTDLYIRHNLQPPSPESINYFPLRKSAAGDVYHDTSVTRKAWQKGYIVLRCTAANVKMRLFLAVGHLEPSQTF